MKQRQLTNWEAAKIGLLLSTGVAFLLLIIWPASLYFTVFATNAMIIGILSFPIVVFPDTDNTVLPRNGLSCLATK